MQNESTSTLGKIPAAGENKKTNRRKKTLLRRAVMKWLLETAAPAGLAMSVSTRSTQYKADIAAFWNQKVRNSKAKKPYQVLKPKRTMIIECYTEREECWPDCAHSRNLAADIKQWKQRKHELESQIRSHEPELREDNVLFSEYTEWRYESSANPEYHQALKKIKELESALLKGTRLEKIRDSGLADEFYLAVPENVIMPEELADSWGLLWVREDMSTEIKKPAGAGECSVDNRMHLVQNIAAAATSDVLFTAGIRENKTSENANKTVLVRPPRGHHQPREYRLNDP